jgi:hypothetical protein
MAWNTGSSSLGELEITCKTSEVAACCSNACESSWVRTANLVSASVSCGLRDLLGAGRVRERDPDCRWRLTMIARPVDEQRIMYRQLHRAAEAAEYVDMPGVIWYRTAAPIQHPEITVGLQKRCSCHNSRSRRGRL